MVNKKYPEEIILSDKRLPKKAVNRKYPEIKITVG